MRSEVGKAGLRFRIVCGYRHQHSDTPHPVGLLRPRDQRPGRCTAQQSNELTPSHSRLSSTMTRPNYQMIAQGAAAMLHCDRDVRVGVIFLLARMSVAGEGRTNLSAGVKPKYRNPATGGTWSGRGSDVNLAQEQTGRGRGCPRPVRWEVGVGAPLKGEGREGVGWGPHSQIHCAPNFALV
jgi:hypothetical protein